MLLSAAQPLLAAATNTVPEPFWRKTSAEPSFKPDWYDNVTPVTHEIFYDSGMTSIQNGNALEAVLENLSAGDHVVVHAGTYTMDSFLYIQAMGTPESPIRVSAAAGEEVILHQSNLGQNAMDINNTAYLILEGFEITGGDQGVRLYSVDHVMMHDNELHGFDGNAYTANSANTSYLYFVDNEIYDTAGNGEAFYLGAHDGSLVTHHSYVVGNYVHDLNNADVSQGDGIEIKNNSYAVTVKWNFVENTNYPGIVAYGTGRGANDRNIIEENVVLFSDDNAIQVSGEAIVRNNLVVTDGTAFMSKPETTNPSHLSVIGNTFVTPARTVRTFGWSAADATDIVFANNALYSATGEYLPNGVGNATSVGNVLVTDLNTSFVNLTLDGAQLDATPSPGSPLIGAADPSYLPPLDLTGAVRTSEPDAGAVDFRDSVAPTAMVLSFEVNGGDENRSGIRNLTLDFSEAVTINAAASLILVNQSTGAVIDLSSAELESNGTASVSWVVNDIPLADGVYSAMLGGGETTPNLAEDYSFAFHKLTGDVDGSGQVNFNDYFAVRTHFDDSGLPFAPGDADGNGQVNFNDYFTVRSNFDALVSSPVLTSALDSTVAFVTATTSKTQSTEGVTARTLESPQLSLVNAAVNSQSNPAAASNDDSSVESIPSTSPPAVATENAAAGEIDDRDVRGTAISAAGLSALQIWKTGIRG